VTDVFQAFADSQMNSPFSLGNWESLTSMEEMFVQTIGDYYGGRDGRVRFNQPIADWDVSRITSMRLMFGCTMRANAGKIGADFNQPINAWDVRAVQSFEGFMGHLGNPGISLNTHAFNQPLSQWNTSAATNMTRMFALARSFNQDISAWNTANVTTLAGMFRGVSGFHGFNRSLNAWDVSAVTDMSEVFSFCDYSQPLGSWNVSAVTTMRAMFLSGLFNQPIGSWDVSGVRDMGFMFASASTNQQRAFFDQDIGAWDVSSVTDMEAMFGAIGAGHSQRSDFQQRWQPLNRRPGMFQRHQHARHVPLGRRQQRQSVPPLQSAHRSLGYQPRHHPARHVSRLPPELRSGYFPMATPPAGVDLADFMAIDVERAFFGGQLFALADRMGQPRRDHERPT